MAPKMKGLPLHELQSMSSIIGARRERQENGNEWKGSQPHQRPVFKPSAAATHVNVEKLATVTVWESKQYNRKELPVISSNDND